MIDGVQLQPLVTHYDERGYFREVARASEPLLTEGFAQWSHSFMHQGVVKAWHYHRQQVDWWYAAVGRLKVALYDLRFGEGPLTVEPMLGPEELRFRRLAFSLGTRSLTAGQLDEFILGDAPALLRIPPGVAHGCRALNDTHLLYLTSREYDASDEGRLPHDLPAIGYDWLKGAEIK
jgi:dTDP-4-dehydrorhamnose 3,5-epimerase